MANYLVTGGAGFYRIEYRRNLLARGESVRVLDNFAPGRRDNIEPFLDRVEFIEGDMNDDEVCRRAVDDIDYVLHQAAIPSVPRSIDEPIYTTEVNVMGTVRLLTAAGRAGVRRFVYAASSSAYGDQQIPAKHEGLVPSPLSPYAAAKLAGEHFCRHVAVDWPGDRRPAYFNVFGRVQDPTSTYSAVIRSSLRP